LTKINEEDSCPSKWQNIITKRQNIMSMRLGTIAKPQHITKLTTMKQRPITRTLRRAICTMPRITRRRAAKLHVEHHGHKAKAAGA
jgi:hypothetical protein